MQRYNVGARDSRDSTSFALGERINGLITSACTCHPPSHVGEVRVWKALAKTTWGTE
jgi:hypothetical protein